MGGEGGDQDLNHQKWGKRTVVVVETVFGYRVSQSSLSLRQNLVAWGQSSKLLFRMSCDIESLLESHDHL